MSKFINASATYSETSLLKNKILRPIIIEYNKSISDNISSSSVLNFTDESKFIIPNNGKKYYLLIVNKNNITEGQITSQESKYKILYFFPSSNDKDVKDYLEKNYYTDYYSEIDSKNFLSKNVYLFEGYMYSNFNYLITDILFMENSTIVCDYSLRFSLINEILFNNLECLKNLNGHFSIGIHPIFEINEQDNNENVIMNIFKNNFIFKDEINSIEMIHNNKLIKENRFSEDQLLNDNIKIIRVDKYIDVFNVYNELSHNVEGILYIRTLVDSKKMIELFKNHKNGEIKIKCQFNHHFKKWAPIFDKI
jgi:hypothetical protein